jgi:hypothetical protein
MLLDAVHQTGADGSSLLLPYLLIVACTVLLFLPVAPFVHRVTHHIPVVLLVVFVATLVYNLAAFPFSAGERYKVYFVQRLDLDLEGGENANRVCYHGVEEFVGAVVAALPSASGREVRCGESKRVGLVGCCFDGGGVVPRVGGRRKGGGDGKGKGGGGGFKGLVGVNATRLGGKEANAARIEIQADNTKACFLEFEKPVAGLRVRGSSGWDERFGLYPEGGVKNLRLWHRRWDEKWVVEVEWKDAAAGDVSPPSLGEEEGEEEGVLGDGELKRRREGLKGAVVCMWSDANVPGTIPALDEALQFAPAWVAVSKLSEGLVEGRKTFEV